MASEAETAQAQARSSLERLVASSGYGDFSLFLSFLLGLNATDPSSTRLDPDENSANGSDPQSENERIILINPFTRGVVVVGGASFSSLLQGDPAKQGPPPASKASIEAMPVVEIQEDEVGECVICLEELKIGGGVVKETPCKHRFHKDCIERWLGIHGSCPVCRFEMPCDEKSNEKKSAGDGERGIWVTFAVRGGDGSGRNPDYSSLGDVHQTALGTDSGTGS